MRRLLILTSVVAALLGAASNAKAAIDPGSMMDTQTVSQLMQWVSARTGVNAPVVPRVVKDHRLFSSLLRISEPQLSRTRGAYIPGTVVIDDRLWDPRSHYAVSFLVHELVHHAQLYSGKKYTCPSAKEAEAYTLQNRWLAEAGKPPAVSQGWIATMSRCNDDSTVASTSVELGEDNDQGYGSMGSRGTHSQYQPRG